MSDFFTSADDDDEQSQRQRDRKAAEAAWEECVEALAWCLNYGSTYDACSYLYNNNPYTLKDDNDN